MRYVVIVGNVGQVVATNNPMLAHSVFNRYKMRSSRNEGRAAGESVVLLAQDEIVREYAGLVQS